MNYNNTRYIIIEGGIGAGKTTLLRNLERIFPGKYIYEYIETETGKEMLANYLKGKLSASAFQYYIANYWLNELDKNKNQPMIIMERGPLAGLAFCEIKDFGTIQCYNAFVSYLKLIRKKFNIINLRFKVINDPINIREVEDLIKSSNDNLVIFISASVDVLKERVLLRNRDGEATAYNNNFLMGNANKLSNIYQNPINEIKSLIITKY